jgi:MurNAc alpha-1-phosphate uridylyltransferase
MGFGKTRYFTGWADVPDVATTLPNMPASQATPRAIILAAGRGERMRPLTDTTPKPLLKVWGKALIEWHIEGLAACGVREIVINTAHLEDQFVPALGDGSRWGVRLTYSHEGRDFGGALETLGGISRALPSLDDLFWVVAGDVFTDFWASQAAAPWALGAGEQARIALVPNPAHNARGDFGLSSQGHALNLPKDGPEPLFTYSTIGLYRRSFFKPPLCELPVGNPRGVKAALAPLLRKGMDAGVVGARLHTGDWTDVGTPERLAQLNA